MRRWIVRWLGLLPPNFVFVVATKGVPIQVCATEAATQDLCASLSPKTTRVHRVPYTTGDEPWT